MRTGDSLISFAVLLVAVAQTVKWFGWWVVALWAILMGVGFLMNCSEQQP